MWILGPIGFTAPWLLIGLAALPILWFLLRAVPPAPIRRRFPGVALLLGLSDDETQTDKTPWWLLLLRMLAVAAAIIGFAGPVLNPQVEQEGEGPLLVLIDGTWAGARDWNRSMARVAETLDEATRGARPVAVVNAANLPEDGALAFQAANSWQSRLPGIRPQPWAPDADGLAAWADGLAGRFDTLWLSDGVDHPGRANTLDALRARGAVRVYESPRPVYALRPVQFQDGQIQATVLRARAGRAAAVTVAAIGPDPNGIERDLARVEVEFDAAATEGTVDIVLPPELRNRITRFAVAGQNSAGAVALTDDSLKRREVALIAGRDGREGLELLSPLHYLRQALVPTADLIDGDLQAVVQANPDVIVLADVATLSQTESDALQDWLDGGGLLLRFAGPRLAASDVSRDAEDPLMPVRLRAGGRNVGGAMSWGEPKTLRPFDETSPFFGLDIPADVAVSAQVMAQPGPELAERVIAALSDGTPLVTRKRAGQGQVVLFHVTANAEWSTLPLSGLFVQMLERLAVSTRPAEPVAEDLTGTTWQVEAVLDGFGDLQDAGTLPGVAGETLVTGAVGPDRRPGLYAGEDRRIAVNVIGAEQALAPATWPADVPVEGLAVVRETPLKGALLAAALILLAVDILASLWLTGRLRGQRAAAMALAAAMLVPPQTGRAQSDDALAIQATSEVVLAHVITGDDRVDRIAQAGMRGLSEKLFQRTSIEPAEPIAVDLETAELSFFPFLYWPVTQDQPLPSATAYARLNRYLRSGGMILFDTRDADIAQFGGNSPNGRRLQQIAAPLDIPPLEPIPEDHVLTRTFYLLQDFPGRHPSRDVWVEAAPADAEQAEGMPFRNLNDGVTPVVIGGNDWAAAWATDTSGMQMFPVGRGYAGERQREIAYRFGINLMMHVLTGNYKSDQVHVPALLERLGQ
ncbi:DUF4159 domain-containing protein [Actibacterium ureilyticum]|uniref:DUF4159 domain-containing protein n=1 Tax=Actibacterium ureilyticum TaxID=1590614 RepID=UPI000BAB09F7|nr:DUF4159 domain-containing protein [Actibacterium ureilyticum]